MLPKIDDAMPPDSTPVTPSARDVGFFMGILTGEGSCGGDGHQPQITIRMHTRHEALFRWLAATFPGSVLYGPYHHGGRSYYQWMARGAHLRTTIAPLIDRNRDLLDAHAAVRFDAMCATYRIDLPTSRRPSTQEAEPAE